MKPTSYKNCQSCGMPLKRDEQGGGTEADGSKSAMYCSHCYQNGRFVLPDITVEQTQVRVRENQRVRPAGFYRRVSYQGHSQAGKMAALGASPTK